MVQAAGGADDIADDFHAPGHAAESPSFTFFRGRGDDLGHRFTEASDSNGLPRLADLFEDAEALGFEHGDGDFFHMKIILWSMTMVNQVLSQCDVIRYFAELSDLPGDGL